jgi:hypothetical protein
MCGRPAGDLHVAGAIAAGAVGGDDDLSRSQAEHSEEMVGVVGTELRCLEVLDVGERRRLPE